MNEKDTLAVFDIQINKIDSSKKILLHQVTNGVDTSSISNMTESTNETPLIYDFIVSGKMNKDHFAIKIAGDRYLREFYLNNQLICIANGNLAPERFVMIDDSISAALLNKLFIIGFNSFFQ
jgi:hypothetical protein